MDEQCSGNNKCRLTVGDTTRQWINGEIMVFDTSIFGAIMYAKDTDDIMPLVKAKLGIE